MGRLLVYAGVSIAVLGLLVMLGERSSIRFGQLPGDLVYRGKNTTVYFPLVTCLLLSLLLTVVSWILGRR